MMNEYTPSDDLNQNASLEAATMGESLFPNFPVDEDEQSEIVSTCNQFKKAAKQHAQQKKKTMQTCYAYTKNQFVGGDLLPVPSTDGSDRDVNSNRPKVFVPVIRQQLKQLYSYLKLTIFPNDTDFFRVRGKTPQAALIEDSLTEGLKYLFRDSLISEKIGAFLYNLCWAGNAAILPTIREDIRWEWSFDRQSQQYVAVQVDVPPMPDLEVLNPINFYIDPFETDAERMKWGYFSEKKLQALKDSNLYFNQDKLDSVGRKYTVSGNVYQDLEISAFNGLGNAFQDTEDSVDYDLYYFPYLKTANNEYRNMVVGVAGEQVLVRFHPNLFPKGLNPAVFCNWMPDVDTQYGTGPIEDIKELQRLINILIPYSPLIGQPIRGDFFIDCKFSLRNCLG